jgi:hypothetical protein
MEHAKRNRKSGFILPVVVSCILVVAIMAGGVLSYVNYGARVAGVYLTASQCRLAAQTALERTKVDIRQTFKSYYRVYPSAWDALSWFDTYSATSVGKGGYTYTLMQNADVNGYPVSVRIDAVEKSSASAVFQYARVTLQATVTGRTTAGVEVSKTIEETVEYSLRRSSVFDHAYFVNNYGWFQGSGCTANGNIRANGNMFLDSLSYINGFAYGAPNGELGAAGTISVNGGGQTRHMSQEAYWSGSGSHARPTNPTDGTDATIWAMGYEAASGLYPFQENLEMPYLGDLSAYREVAYNAGGTITQSGKVLVDGCYSAPGPSGIVNGADQGCLVLDGTSKPIIIDGPVVVDGDVIIKGTVSGQGAIYAGRNIHIVGNVTYKSSPSWPKPDTNPSQTVKSNASKDMLGLVAKGNIVLGNYTDSSWLSSVKGYITPPFVKAYSCDPTDASIGYPSTFGGDYTAADSGKKVNYVYDSATKTYKPSGTTNRKYFESAAGDQVINNSAGSATITQVDAVLYNNHAVMGKIGQSQFNGALVSRDEGIIYSSSVKFNWDIRLGSRSPDGIDFFIYLPMSIAEPRVISWREVI